MKHTKIYLGTNLKMYKNIRDTVRYLQDLEQYTKDIDRNLTEIFVFPSYTALSATVQSVNQEYIKIGAQNMHWEEQGQFTGEISPLMLKELNIDIIEIGHSERRQLFGETNLDLNKKVISAIQHDFTSLLCIGETLEEKNFGISDEVLRIQLKTGLYHMEAGFLKHLWIAYEPVWAIGVNGIPASAGYAQQKHRVIKETLYDLFGMESCTIPVLYGGSVNQENATELICQPDIDGLFIGRSAWDAASFNTMIRKILQVCIKQQH